MDPNGGRRRGWKILNELITSHYPLTNVLLVEIGHGVAAAVERDEIFQFGRWKTFTPCLAPQSEGYVVALSPAEGVFPLEAGEEGERETLKMKWKVHPVNAQVIDNLSLYLMVHRWDRLDWFTQILYSFACRDAIYRVWKHTDEPIHLWDAIIRGCIKIGNIFHFVTPSVVEGSHIILSQDYVRCLDKLDMTVW